MGALFLAVVLAQLPPLPAGLPGVDAKKPQMKASETAKLYYLAGDLSTAREWCERGLKKEGPVCKPFLKHLAEYAFLLGKFEPLTLGEAKQVIELDRRLSPAAAGKLTKPVQERFVLGPLARARAWAIQGAPGEAIRFVDEALQVDPTNADAKALRLQLLAAADGGVPFDAGVPAMDGGR
jgi:tetratricopeptide (TPR) repeat protein